MEPKHLSYFKVENFKRFDSLEVNDIGQFNLIVGDNNVGKTSLLEALLFDDDDYGQCQFNFWTTLKWKKILLNVQAHNLLGYFLKNKKQPITFSFNKDNSRLLIRPRLRADLNLEESEKLATQLFLNNNLNHLLEFQNNGMSSIQLVSDTLNSSTYVPFVGFTMTYDQDLVRIFSAISIETANLKQLESDLKLFIPNLESIEINSAIIPQETVVAIRESNKDLIPLLQYGDGTIKLFRYLLELNLCENKRLMIDEIDTGIHYSRLKDYLKMVIQTAKNKNVQIFATTHSKECLQYYKEALEELKLQDDARIIRLADTKHGTHSFTYNFAQFDNALLAGSEIR